MAASSTTSDAPIPPAAPRGSRTDPPGAVGSRPCSRRAEVTPPGSTAFFALPTPGVRASFLRSQPGPTGEHERAAAPGHDAGAQARLGRAVTQGVLRGVYVTQLRWQRYDGGRARAICVLENVPSNVVRNVVAAAAPARAPCRGCGYLMGNPLEKVAAGKAFTTNISSNSGGHEQEVSGDPVKHDRRRRLPPLLPLYRSVVGNSIALCFTS